jgi:hypothetical protein
MGAKDQAELHQRFPSTWLLHSSSQCRFQVTSPISLAEGPLSTIINIRGGGKKEDTPSKRVLSLILKAKPCLACV